MYPDSKVFFDLESSLNRVFGVAMNGIYLYWSDIENDNEIIKRSLNQLRSTKHKREDIVTTGKRIYTYNYNLYKVFTEITF